MDYLDLRSKIDYYILKIEELSDKRSVRFLNAVIPLLLMNKTTKRLTYYTLNTYQITANAYQLKYDYKKHGLKLAHTFTQIGFSAFYPNLAPLYSTLIQIGSDPKNKACWIDQTLKLTTFYTRRYEILAFSLIFQTVYDCQEGCQEVHNKRYIEAFGKFVSAVTHGYMSICTIRATPEINRFNRIWKKIEPFKTKLTRAEFKILIKYIKEAPTVERPTYIEGSDHHLPYSLTLTSEGVAYIHLDQCLGGGPNKKAYDLLKIGKTTHLMTEIRVYTHPDHALKEERLSKEIGSSYIIRESELTLRHGDTLSLIQERMDMDGYGYCAKGKGSAHERLKVTEDVARGLGDLHNAGWLHGNLHLGSILLNLNPSPKGKLGNLEAAYPQLPSDLYLQQVEIQKLGFLTEDICRPLWEQFSDNPQMQKLQQTIKTISKNTAESSISAYEVAEQLEKIRLSLEEEGTFAFKPCASLTSLCVKN